MTTLIYCSYAIMDVPEEPAWVKLLAERTVLWDAAVVLYRPRLQIHEQPLLLAELQKRARAEADKTELAEILETEKLEVPISEYLVMRDLYVLNRSDIFIVDCNTPSYGGVGMEQYHASQKQLHRVAVADRFVIGPWQHYFCDVLVRTQKLVQYLEDRLGK